MYEYRCDERLKAKDEGCTRLAYTGLRGVESLLHVVTSNLRTNNLTPNRHGECQLITTPLGATTRRKKTSCHFSLLLGGVQPLIPFLFS
jgi:hypothetical protein